MSFRFYKSLGLEHYKTVLVTGIGNRDQLITQLGHEAASSDRRAMITTDSNAFYPPEGQFLVGNDIDLLLKSMQSKSNAGTLYLAKDLKNEKLIPFNNNTLISMTGMLENSSQLFISVDSSNKSLLDALKADENVLVICTIDFEPIRQDLLEARLEQTVDESTKETQKMKEIEQLLSSICHSSEWNQYAERFILFVNRINDLFDENLFIPVGRYLKQKGLSSIYFGSLQNYQIKQV